MKYWARLFPLMALYTLAAIFIPLPESVLAQTTVQGDTTDVSTKVPVTRHVSFVHIMDVIPVKGATQISEHNRASQRRIVAFAPTMTSASRNRLASNWAVCIESGDRCVSFVDSATSASSRPVLQDPRLYPGDMTLRADGVLALTLQRLQPDGSLAENSPSLLWILPPPAPVSRHATDAQEISAHLQVAEGNIRLPRWSADGKSLYYWRKVADEKRAQDSTQISFEKWQVFCASPPWSTPHLEAVAGTESRRPYPIPAGSDLAVCWPIVAPSSMAPAVMNLVQLTDDRTTQFPLAGLPTWAAPENACWSGDNQFVALSLPDNNLPLNHAIMILRRSTGQITNLNEPLAKYVRETLREGQPNQIFAICAIAALGSTTRYLVCYEFTQYPSDFIVDNHTNSQQPEEHWLVYDALDGHIEVADGLPTHWHGLLLSTPDGHIVQVGLTSGLYQLR